MLSTICLYLFNYFNKMSTNYETELVTLIINRIISLNYHVQKYNYFSTEFIIKMYLYYTCLISIDLETKYGQIVLLKIH